MSSFVCWDAEYTGIQVLQIVQICLVRWSVNDPIYKSLLLLIFTLAHTTSQFVSSSTFSSSSTLLSNQEHPSAFTAWSVSSAVPRDVDCFPFQVWKMVTKFCMHFIYGCTQFLRVVHVVICMSGPGCAKLTALTFRSNFRCQCLKYPIFC